VYFTDVLSFCNIIILYGLYCLRIKKQSHFYRVHGELTCYLLVVMKRKLFKQGWSPSERNCTTTSYIQLQFNTTFSLSIRYRCNLQHVYSSFISGHHREWRAGIPLAGIIPPHLFVPVPTQDLDFQRHMPWYFCVQ
jgi:hypothetical protein